MTGLSALEENRIFYYFDKLTKIPRGSGNTRAVSEFCVDFAKKHNLDYVTDEVGNVIIYKDATKGYENSECVILQGHLDMVCQKTDDLIIDFETQGINAYIDGEFITADRTTLGADNGIALAMIMAILESDEYSHPPIEAVFTIDEEIGMIGAIALDTKNLKGKKLINLDSEEEDILTVSCAGGSDFLMEIPYEKTKTDATKVIINIKGLKGGHSGVEIDKNRVNAAVLAGRILNHLSNSFEFFVACINSGDKANAIPLSCEIELVTKDSDALIDALNEYADKIKTEISHREPEFLCSAKKGEKDLYTVMDKKTQNKLIYSLLCTPNGIMEMSSEICNLVETSLNLGILKTLKDKIVLQYALRSNKQSVLCALEEKMFGFARLTECKAQAFGHYPPWEFKNNSRLQELYKEAYKSVMGKQVNVLAIHAGLECGVFASKIKDIDCIAIGPQMYDVHTVNERLEIKSVEKIFSVVLELLKNL